jgi:hypothetical protein
MCTGDKPFKLLDDNIDSDIGHVLEYQFSKQEATVLWNSFLLQPLMVGNGMQQSRVLSPYLSTKYI